jgi:penicillin V acylase-like amidase (Ntn superfamily)
MCTRTFNNQTKYRSTGRNMDWGEPFNTNLWAFKSGAEREGCKKIDLKGTDITPLKWTSLYGSIVTIVSNNAASDGMNTEGLVANALWQSDCAYPDKKTSKGEGLNVLMWVQYVLDNFKTVEEVVKKFRQKGVNKIVMIGGQVSAGDAKPQEALIHLSVSDKSGDSAIIEVNNDEFNIHHSHKYQIMTNEPTYTEQLNLNQYWEYQWKVKSETVEGEVVKSRYKHSNNSIPGTPFPIDRFARASFYTSQLKKAKSSIDSVAQTLSIQMNACVPISVHLAGDDSGPTQWTTVSDQYELKYYFRNSYTPNTIWVDLESMDLNDENEGGQGTIELVNANDKSNAEYNGSVNEHFCWDEKDPYTQST